MKASAAHRTKGQKAVAPPLPLEAVVIGVSAGGLKALSALRAKAVTVTQARVPMASAAQAGTRVFLCTESISILFLRNDLEVSGFFRIAAMHVVPTCIERA